MTSGTVPLLNPVGMSVMTNDVVPRKADDNEFHALGAATKNARSPRIARRVDGTSNEVVSAERRPRRAEFSVVL